MTPPSLLQIARSSSQADGHKGEPSRMGHECLVVTWWLTPHRWWVKSSSLSVFDRREVPLLRHLLRRPRSTECREQ